MTETNWRRESEMAEQTNKRAKTEESGSGKFVTIVSIGEGRFGAVYYVPMEEYMEMEPIVKEVLNDPDHKKRKQRKQVDAWFDSMYGKYDKLPDGETKQTACLWEGLFSLPSEKLVIIQDY
jgi:hypothetical protein